MESLSRPFHSRKLSNASTFSTKNAYDGVFSGHRRKYAGVSAVDVQDYREIFGSSQAASSIPVLDLSTLGEQSDALSLNLRTSKPDYSIIFGGFRDEDVAVSYEELFARDKARAPKSTTRSSQDSDNLFHQSPDALKQFSMSYNKISQKTKDGLDGTKHVTQLHATPGFTRFIDEPVMKAEKQPSENAVRKQNNPVESKTFDIDSKIHPSTLSSSPSVSPTNFVNHENYPKRSTTINSESCKTDSSPAYCDEELDVNSAAFALKKAIEKAQESIRIAKESVGRKKKNLRSFSNKKFKDSLKVEGKMEDVTAANSSQVFPDFMDGKKLFVAKKVIDEIHEKISESTKDSKFGDNIIVSNSREITSETESKPLDSAGKDEYATSSSESADTEKGRIHTSEFMHKDQRNNMSVDEYEAKIKVTKSTNIFEHQSVVKEQESVERDCELESKENKDKVRLSNANELVKELNNLNVSQKEEDEKKVSQDFSQDDNENRLNALENEQQEEVLEQDDVENAENVEGENEFKDEHKTEIHKEEEINEMFCDDCELEMEESAQNCDNILEGIKDSAETCDNSLEESEVNLHDYCKIKQEDNITVEKKEESLDESCDQEFNEKSSVDENVMEENDNIDSIHVASNIVDMNNNNVETTQDIDDVPESSCEFQAEEEEEEEFCEKISIDQTVSDENEDEYEIKSEENYAQSEEHDVQSEEKNIIDNLADLGLENDVQSESSSSAIKGVKIEEEEINIQLPHEEIPDIKTTDEIEDSKEIEEPGPSKVSGQENFRKIDEEMAAKEREREKNRLAVERAIREARERAFAEARERAERERAAVEKATEEVRQRMMAEAHEKVAKASSVGNKSFSAQSKLRAERAAVERATSEARQRALEKAMSLKTVSDLNSSESALRTKAKLEKHNRIMERAAKALAEKEKRDRLAQKEQAERNRLAENLDADIKRWSNGKEGNLRALLSTLQYILGPESGWQPISLTEIITTSAVKKAYRKATLCVHPDKLQQRGASIQQKYMCEKVFDLLKAAWNRFNVEER